jgi:hypothetical protein
MMGLTFLYALLRAAFLSWLQKSNRRWLMACFKVLVIKYGIILLVDDKKLFWDFFLKTEQGDKGEGKKFNSKVKKYFLEKGMNKKSNI